MKNLIWWTGVWQDRAGNPQIILVLASTTVRAQTNPLIDGMLTIIQSMWKTVPAGTFSICVISPFGILVAFAMMQIGHLYFSLPTDFDTPWINPVLTIVLMYSIFMWPILIWRYMALRCLFPARLLAVCLMELIWGWVPVVAVVVMHVSWYAASDTGSITNVRFCCCLVCRGVEKSRSFLVYTGMTNRLLSVVSNEKRYMAKWAADL